MIGFDKLTNPPTLSRRLAQGPLHAHDALRHALQLGESLLALHQQGQVHGCLCPSTIALQHDAVQLLPARNAARSATAYAAPEVLAGHAPDALSDIFSFGAVVYQILTGTPPFAGSDRSIPLESGSTPLNRLVAACLLADPRMRQQSLRRVVMQIKLLPMGVGRLEAVARARTLLPGSRPPGSARSAVALLAAFRRGIVRAITSIKETCPTTLAAETAIVVTAMTAGILWGAGLASPRPHAPPAATPERISQLAASVISSPHPGPKPFEPTSVFDSGDAASCSTFLAISRPPMASHSASTETIKQIVASIAAYESLPPELLHSVIKVESNYDPNTVSARGAQGLMQLVPDTAQRFGVTDVFSPTENIQGGAKYLRHLLSLYKGDYVKTLAAYNAGEGAVAKFNGVPPYPETRNYLTEVRKQLEKSIAPQSVPAPVNPQGPVRVEPVTDNAAYPHHLPF